MRRQETSRAALLVAVVAALATAGCADPDLPAPGELNTRYESRLAATEALAADFERDGEAEQAALRKLELYFSAMTPDSVRASTADVYAPDGWLYDNLTIVEGADEIEAYFVHAAGQADGLSIDFLQVARSGADYFVRWRMTINAPALGDGEPLVSYGVTQFRFDSRGRVLVHRDFWDAGTGIYEYLPGVGGFVRAVRSRLAAY